MFYFTDCEFPEFSLVDSTVIRVAADTFVISTGCSSTTADSIKLGHFYEIIITVRIYNIAMQQRELLLNHGNMRKI